MSYWIADRVFQVQLFHGLFQLDHPLLLSFLPGHQLGIPSIAQLELSFGPNYPRLIHRHLIQCRLQRRGSLGQLMIKPRYLFKFSVAEVSSTTPRQCSFINVEGSSSSGTEERRFSSFGVKPIRTPLENLESPPSSAKG